MSKLICAALAVAALGLPASADASGATCDREHRIQVGPSSDGVGSTGVVDQVYTYNWSQDNCRGPIVETDLILLSPDAFNWIEIGYKKCTKPCGEAPAGVTTYVFSEYGIYAAVSVAYETSISLVTQTTPRFKVVNQSNTNNWLAYVDTAGGSNFVQVLTANGLSNNSGYPQGEVAGYGILTDDFTGHIWGLSYRKPDGTWHNWTTRSCEVDEFTPPAPAYEVYTGSGIVAQNEFAVVTGLGDCTSYSPNPH
jgi:hypothetical protein